MPERAVRIRSALGAAIIGALVLAGAARAETLADVAGRLERVVAQTRAGTTLGLVVLNLDSGQMLFSHQADRLLRPASVLKLFTTAAALEHFPSDFAFETRLYWVDSELLVLGGGDPGLGDERLEALHQSSLNATFDGWANALRERGVRQLRHVVIDDSVFDQQWRHPDWPADQATAWYQAPAGGLNLNDNCVDARITLRGGRIELNLRPPLPPAFVANRLSAGRRHAPAIKRASDADIFELVGSAARNAELGPISVRRPDVFFGHAVQAALADRGIELTGDVRRRTLAPAALTGATPIASHRTTLQDVIWRANNFSQNLFAECLLKGLEAYQRDGRRSGRPGSWAGGAAELTRTLSGLGVPLAGGTIRDGSGLSHENRVGAAQIVALLRVMHTHPRAADFRASLATPGQDGTMRRWNAAWKERLRGKTGSIQGVRGLAGYVTRPDGAALAFALLAEGPDADALPKRVAEALLE